MTSSVVEPFKIGYLDEGITPDPSNFEAGSGRVLRLRFDEALESGELDRPIEIVVRRGVGLPHGTAKAVQDAWRELADAGCLLIIGPGITDNCIAVTPMFEAGQVATINFPGTTHSRGRYGFHYQIGALYWDGPLIARAIAQAGFSRVSVIRDRSPIGDEYFDYFNVECERSGLSITSDTKCSPVATDLSSAVAQAQVGQPEALVYLGYGGVLVDLSRALAAAGWTPPRFTTSAGMHWYAKSAAEREELTGWVYVDQVDEDNDVNTAMSDRFEKRYGTRPFSPLAGGVYDMATLAVLALRNAPVFTTEGIVAGLERIHQEPAALGGRGTVMGFGPYERTALKGADYLVLRRMDGQQTVRYR
jgi:branched-chain amino acid transport system substrate-binding protein